MEIDPINWEPFALVDWHRWILKAELSYAEKRETLLKKEVGCQSKKHAPQPPEPIGMIVESTE